MRSPPLPGILFASLMFDPRMDSSFLSDRFAAGLSYDRYLQSATPEQLLRWKHVFDAAHLNVAQQELIAGFVREMKILVFSGLWCGDCVEQCPLLQRIALANPAKIDLRFIERPRDAELPPQVRMNAASRVPVALFLSEDMHWCATYGDRTVNRYRAVARRKLGPICPTGLFVPDREELDSTLAHWLCEVERVQLMLRLTPRLREKYQD